MSSQSNQQSQKKATCVLPAMAAAYSRLFLVAQTPVQFQANPCGTSSAQKYLDRLLSESVSCPVSVPAPVLHAHFFAYDRRYITLELTALLNKHQLHAIKLVCRAAERYSS